MKRYILPVILLCAVFLVGWTVLGDNFLGIELTQATPTNGQVWAFDSATGKYKLSLAANGGIVVQKGGTTVDADATILNFDTTAFGVTSNPAGTANVSATFGTTVGTIEQGNDARNPPAPSVNGAVVVDTGVAYTKTAQGAANTLLHGVGAGTPTFSKLVDGDVTALTLTGASMAANTVTLGKVGVAGANARIVGSGSAGVGISYTELSATAPLTIGASAIAITPGSNSTVLQTNAGGTVTFATVTDAEMTALTLTAASMAATVTNRLAPTPATNGAVIIDNGTSMTETAQGAANTLLHGVGAGTPTFSAVVNADVSATAAIAITKLQNAAASSRLLGSGATGSGASYVEATLDATLAFAANVLGVVKVPDNIANITAATSMTLAPTGDHLIVGGSAQAIRIPSRTGAPANPGLRDTWYDPTVFAPFLNTDYNALTKLPGLFFVATTSSTDTQNGGVDQTFANTTTGNLPANWQQLGNQIEFEFAGRYTPGTTTPGMVQVKIVKNATAVVSSTAIGLTAGGATDSWVVRGGITGRSATTSFGHIIFLVNANTLSNRNETYDASNAAVTFSAAAETLSLSINIPNAATGTNSFTCNEGWWMIH